MKPKCEGCTKSNDCYIQMGLSEHPDLTTEKIFAPIIAEGNPDMIALLDTHGCIYYEG